MARRRVELSKVSVASAVFSGPAGARAVEDDVGHLLAAQRLDALLAQHPFDGVDDVALAGAVGSHHDRDAGRELEPGFVGKALEADEFQGFEHRGRRACGRKMVVAADLWKGAGQGGYGRSILSRNTAPGWTNSAIFPAITAWRS